MFEKQIQSISEIPKLERFENETGSGFKYPEEYINNIYKFETNYIIFRDSSYELYEIPRVEIEAKLIFELLKDKFVIVDDLNKLKKSMGDKFENALESLSNKLSDKINDTIIESNRDIFKSLETQYVANEKNIEHIQNNLNDLINNLKEYIDSSIKNIKSSLEDTKGKPKLSTIVRLREDGISIKEMKDLNDNGLI